MPGLLKSLKFGNTDSFTQKEEKGRVENGGLAKPSTLWKKVIDFHVPSRDVTNQTLPGRE